MKNIKEILKSKFFKSERLGVITLSIILTEFSGQKYYECQIEFFINENKETIFEECENFNVIGLKNINKCYAEYDLETIEYCVDCCIEQFELDTF